MAQAPSQTKRLARAGASLAALFCTLAAAPAGAHFILDEPASWMSQDALGTPQKLGPCGDEGGGTASNTVTAFSEGQTITVTIDEKIYHPGHYRIALAVHDRSELPAEPVVTPNSTPCGTVDVESPPVFPVLADGVFDHMAPFTTPQSVQVTLPAGVTCDKCTLQVIEFMSDHPLNNPGGCFYHHCADISIGTVIADGGGGPASSSSSNGSGFGTSAASGTGGSATTAGGSTSGAGGSAGDGPSSSGGCGFSTPEGGAPALTGVGSLLALMLVLRGRRDRASSRRSRRPG